jgi:hypothetical protein
MIKSTNKLKYRVYKQTVFRNGKKHDEFIGIEHEHLFNDILFDTKNAKFIAEEILRLLKQDE